MQASASTLSSLLLYNATRLVAFADFFLCCPTFFHVQWGENMRGTLQLPSSRLIAEAGRPIAVSLTAATSEASWAGVRASAGCSGSGGGGYVSELWLWRMPVTDLGCFCLLSDSLIRDQCVRVTGPENMNRHRMVAPRQPPDKGVVLEASAGDSHRRRGGTNGWKLAGAGRKARGVSNERGCK